jgi:hypothetical protein
MSAVKTIRLIHWNEAEARERAARLEECGYAVEWRVRPAPDLLAELKTTRASALVIDLDRLPSHGRDVGIYVRRAKATRTLPIVFVAGEPTKVARIRQVLPDAEYTTWAGVGGSLARALARSAEPVVVPASVFAPYASRPLAEKLGVREGAVVALLHAPPDFLQTLGAAAARVSFVARLSRDLSLAIWFVRSRRELDARIGAVAGRVAGFPLWIAWPKKTGGSAPDVTQQDVRRAGLAEGLVDYKICSIDATWSALLFRRRR